MNRSGDALIYDIVDFDKVGIGLRTIEPDGTIRRTALVLSAQAALDHASRLKQLAKKARAWKHEPEKYR